MRRSHSVCFSLSHLTYSVELQVYLKPLLKACESSLYPIYTHGLLVKQHHSQEPHPLSVSETHHQ